MTVPLNTFLVKKFQQRVKCVKDATMKCGCLSGGQSHFVVGMVLDFVPRLRSLDNIAYQL
jgi:hypothetical protein